MCTHTRARILYETTVECINCCIYLKHVVVCTMVKQLINMKYLYLWVSFWRMFKVLQLMEDTLVQSKQAQLLLCKYRLQGVFNMQPYVYSESDFKKVDCNGTVIIISKILALCTPSLILQQQNVEFSWIKKKEANTTRVTKK